MNEPTSRWQAEYPHLNFEPLSVKGMTTHERYCKERDLIFKKSWLYIARTLELPEPGDYVVRELPVCGTSLIIVRGEDGQVRAFHNMCSHRGNKLVRVEPNGNVRGFKCNFHGWTYGLDGALVVVPDEEAFLGFPNPGFERCDLGLTEVACDVWETFIFVNVDPEPETTLEEYLGPQLWDQYSGQFDDYELVACWDMEIKANWKIIIDSFIEIYHFKTLHGKTAADMFCSAENPHGHMAAMELFERHARMSVTGNFEHKATPSEQLAAKFATEDLFDSETVTEPKALPPGVNPKRVEGWISDSLVLFPNLIVNPLPGWFIQHHVEPLDFNRTNYQYRLFKMPPRTAGEEIAQEYSKVFLRDTVREDVNTLEGSQLMLESGAKSHILLGEWEVLLRHMHGTIADMVGETLSGEPK
ncbi:MAG: aromatic ring-hydroxylating dioxygenase subunit alpha [Gammaproteobacteria bacterium]|nr:aromatic ring-hydroxylating dioxygenase subunit alpha [Gammaproteobacteria bacterium]